MSVASAHSQPIRYFDNAATSFPKPPAVGEAMARYMVESGAPARGAHGPAREASRLVFKCRDRIARLVNLASPEHVVFGYNTTDGLNLGVKGVLAAARRKAGAGRAIHVVTTVMEHNSILRPLNAAMGLDRNVQVTHVPADPGTGLVDPGDVRRAIRPGETVLVCVNHASNVMGTVQDIEQIGRECAAFGAGSGDVDGLLFLVDGAQSLGHWPVDMQAAHIDLLAFPGHKGLLGPTGTGGLCIRPGVEKRLDTIREGGTGSTSEQQTHPTMMPEKYEAGSHNTVGIIGLSEGVAWLLGRGMEAARAHEIELMERMLTLLAPDERGTCASAPGLRLLGPREIGRRVGVFSFVHDELASQEMAGILEASYGVLTRAGLHCAPLVHEMLGTSPVGRGGVSGVAGSGAVRLSFGPFLTVRDVEYACAALAEICREHRAGDRATTATAGAISGRSHGESSS